MSNNISSILTDQCLAQASSQNLLPATDRNKYRDPQPDTTQRVRDLGTLSPKWMSLPNASPQSSGNRREDEAERVLTARRDRGHQDNKTLWISKCKWTHRDWSSRHRAYTGLHIYTISLRLALLYDCWMWGQWGRRGGWEIRRERHVIL